VRELGVDAACAKRIHPARLGRLLAETAVMTVQHIADLEPARRTAVLVAQVAELEARLADATLAMFEKYIGSLFSKAQNRDERRFQASKRDVAKALLLFRRTIAALRQAQQTGEDVDIRSRPIWPCRSITSATGCRRLSVARRL
jgi:hypothetical protein